MPRKPKKLKHKGNGKGNKAVVPKRVGRPPAKIDLKEVERLASLGMPLKYIAKGLGISENTFMKVRTGNGNGTLTEVSAALEKGFHTLRQELLGCLIGFSKKNFIPAMFLSKQPHLLDFADVRGDVKHSGKIEVVVRRGIIEPSQDAIEVDYEEVD